MDSGECRYQTRAARIGRIVQTAVEEGTPGWSEPTA